MSKVAHVHICCHLTHFTVLRVSSAADGEREEFQNIVAWTLASAVSTQGIIVNFEDIFIFHGSPCIEAQMFQPFSKIVMN